MSRLGRPRALSHATLEEAANELFLEQGYANTSVDDIAARAGVSRATFFNYFDQKSDLLFVSVDQAIDAVEIAAESGRSLQEALQEVADTISRSGVPLVATQAEAMGALEDALGAAPARLLRLRQIVSLLVPEPVWQWAIAGAVAEGAMEWATSPPGTTNLVETIEARVALLQDFPAGYFW